MAEIPIAVLWDSRKERLSVHPGFVTLLDETDDVPADEATWVLLSDDTDVEMHPSDSVVFDGPPKGPFRNLGRDPKNPKKSRGQGLQRKPHPENFKYTVTVSKHGQTIAVEDPGLRREPR